MFLKPEPQRAASTLWAIAGLLIGALASGCSDDKPETSDDHPPAPDGSAPESSGSNDLEVQPLMYTPPEQPVVLLHDGDPIELFRPPQGGHVLLVGARVKGLESNYVELRVRVRNPDTAEIHAEKATTVAMETVPEDPTLKQNDRRSISQVAHIAVCPDYDPRDIVGAEQRIEVEITELYADFSTGTANVTVVPTCMQTSAAEKTHCECECAGNYVPGRCGRVIGDAGSGDAATP